MFLAEEAGEQPDRKSVFLQRTKIQILIVNALIFYASYFWYHTPTIMKQSHQI